jgi:hypothetical protein
MTTLTQEAILRAMEEVARTLKPMPRPMRIVENALAVKAVPVRKHQRRRGQTGAYHRRVQKKWMKRFGTKQVPCAYMVDNSYLGGVGQTMIAHPSLVAKLRSMTP